MKPSMFFLPLAAIVLVSVCYWKHNQEEVVSNRTPPNLQPVDAIGFELPDQDLRVVRLATYLHRHRILLIFFDGESGPASNPWLSELRDNQASLSSEGIIVLGISNALPQKNRLEKFPFPILTDLNPAKEGSLYRAHKTWGVFDETLPSRTQPSVFYITRAGTTLWDNSGPKPVARPQDVIRALLAGRNPEKLL